MIISILSSAFIPDEEVAGRPFSSGVTGRWVVLDRLQDTPITHKRTPRGPSHQNVVALSQKHQQVSRLFSPGRWIATVNNQCLIPGEKKILSTNQTTGPKRWKAHRFCNACTKRCTSRDKQTLAVEMPFCSRRLCPPKRPFLKQVRHQSQRQGQTPQRPPPEAFPPSQTSGHDFRSTSLGLLFILWNSQKNVHI